jgi:flagellar hook-basal body complex protein FliE
MIAGVRAASAYARAAEQTIAAKPAAPGMAEQFDQAIRQVDALQFQGDVALKELASGQNVDLHGTMVALEKADIALRTMVSVRDRVVAAYEQIMNMAI